MSRWLFALLALVLGCSQATKGTGAPSSGGAGGMLAPGGGGGAGGAAGVASGGMGGMGAMGGTGGMLASGGMGGMVATGGSGGSGDAGGGGDSGAPDAGPSAPDITPEHGLIIPTAEWTCGMPDGIPAPEDGTLAVSIELELGATIEVGATPFGERRVYPATGGSATGMLSADAVTGGLEWELTLPSGAREIELRQVLRADDGSLVYMRACGVGAGQGARLVVDLEIGSGSDYSALRETRYVATRVIEGSVSRLALYDVASGASASQPVHAIERSAEDRALRVQPWECVGPVAGTSEGAALMVANVGIGGSLAVGETQLGSRNIIPITGGDFSGMGLASGVSGEVVPGGADFQLSGATFFLEARYTLQTSDGSYIVVRNCGGVGGTTPYLEVALDSPHAALNDGEYFGRIGIQIGGVRISMFEASR